MGIFVWARESLSGTSGNAGRSQTAAIMHDIDRVTRTLKDDGGELAVDRIVVRQQQPQTGWTALDEAMYGYEVVDLARRSMQGAQAFEERFGRDRL